MDKWISVKDRLPDAYDTVLCCCHYGENKRKMLIGYHDGDEWMCAYTVTHWAPPVTHWAPLPEYPEDEEEGI